LIMHMNVILLAVVNREPEEIADEGPKIIYKRLGNILRRL